MDPITATAGLSLWLILVALIVIQHIANQAIAEPDTQRRSKAATESSLGSLDVNDNRGAQSSKTRPESDCHA